MSLNRSDNATPNTSNGTSVTSTTTSSAASTTAKAVKGLSALGMRQVTNSLESASWILSPNPSQASLNRNHSLGLPGSPLQFSPRMMQPTRQSSLDVPFPTAQQLQRQQLQQNSSSPSSPREPQHVRQNSLMAMSRAEESAAEHHHHPFDGPDLGLPPTLALERTNSLAVPQDAHLPRTASDAAAISRPSMSRMQTAEELQALVPTRISSTDSTSGIFPNESPSRETESLIPADLNMNSIAAPGTISVAMRPEDLLVKFSSLLPQNNSLPTPKRNPQGKSSQSNRPAAASNTTTKKTYVCDFMDPKTKKPCGQSFTRKGGLTSHRKVHKATKVFKCKFHKCKETFPTAALKQAHERTVHAGQRVRPKKAYKCDWVDPVTGEKCPKVYTHTRSLIEHKCKHLGTFLHQCKDCGKKFTVNSNFRRHRDKVDCKAKMEKKRLKEMERARAEANGGAAKRMRRNSQSV